MNPAFFGCDEDIKLYVRSLVIIPFSFAERSEAFDQMTDPEIFGSLPAAPTTVKRFVGRTAVLDRLFQWLQTSDEPRTFLYGKGGSGKTTIAYEFARLVRNLERILSYLKESA